MHRAVLFFITIFLFNLFTYETVWSRSFSVSLLEIKGLSGVYEEIDFFINVISPENDDYIRDVHIKSEEDPTLRHQLTLPMIARNVRWKAEREFIDYAVGFFNLGYWVSKLRHQQFFENELDEMQENDRKAPVGQTNSILVFITVKPKTDAARRHLFSEDYLQKAEFLRKNLFESRKNFPEVNSPDSWESNRERKMDQFKLFFHEKLKSGKELIEQYFDKAFFQDQILLAGLQVAIPTLVEGKRIKTQLLPYEGRSEQFLEYLTRPFEIARWFVDPISGGQDSFIGVIAVKRALSQLIHDQQKNLIEIRMTPIGPVPIFAIKPPKQLVVEVVGFPEDSDFKRNLRRYKELGGKVKQQIQDRDFPARTAVLLTAEFEDVEKKLNDYIESIFRLNRIKWKHEVIKSRPLLMLDEIGEKVIMNDGTTLNQDLGSFILKDPYLTKESHR